MPGRGNFAKATSCPSLLLVLLLVVNVVLYLTTENHEVLFSTRRKRAEDTLPPEGDTESQAQKVYVQLPKTPIRRKTHAGRPVVHCGVVGLCHTDALLADCHCSHCSVYTVVMKEDGHVLSSLSATQFADLVTVYLRHRSFTTVSDLNQLLDVHCHHSQSLQLQITGDVLPQPVCFEQRSGTSKEREKQQGHRFRNGQEHGGMAKNWQMWREIQRNGNAQKKAARSNSKQREKSVKNGQQRAGIRSTIEQHGEAVWDDLQWDESDRNGQQRENGVSMRNDKMQEEITKNCQQWGKIVRNGKPGLEIGETGSGSRWENAVRNDQQWEYTMGTGQEREESQDNQPHGTQLKEDIHILYFRYLSHKQLATRLPGLMSLLHRAGREGWARVDNLDNHQASVWGDHHVLSLLLQGRRGRFHFRDSLLSAARQGGYCLRLQDLSCRGSRAHARLVTRVRTAGRAAACRDHGQRHRKSTVGRLCTATNSTTARFNALLMASLAPDIDQRPVLSLSLLTPRDPALLDTALRNVFLRALGSRGGLLVLIGGLGDPAFLRFDRSVLQQLHTSRPAMLLCDMRSSAASPLLLLNGASFSMLHVHRMVKQLITNTSMFHSDTSVSRESEDSRSCQNLGVRPPFLCLQEEQFAPYENDTLMSGFAELAVTLINAQLRNITPSPGRHSHCGRVRGESFSNVQLGRYKQRYRVLMDLTLSPCSSSEHVQCSAMLDVWDTHRVARAALRLSRPGAVNPESSSAHCVHALCSMGDSLDPQSGSLLQRWSKERHFGLEASVTHVHDSCLFLLVRDFGHSASVQLANVCGDRRYDVTLRVSLLNMVSLAALTIVVSLGHVQREVVAVIIKLSYTVGTSAYKLDPDFTVFYD